jgi:hypothetical protein
LLRWGITWKSFVVTVVTKEATFRWKGITRPTPSLWGRTSYDYRRIPTYCLLTGWNRLKAEQLRGRPGCAERPRTGEYQGSEQTGERLPVVHGLSQ